jgi:hypothetical protein
MAYSGRTLSACLSGVVLCFTAMGSAQEPIPLARLSPEVFDVTPPSDRVTGAPGAMRVLEAGCGARSAPVDAGLRRRIVDVAVQEWAFFGFRVVDQTGGASSGFTTRSSTPTPQRRRRSRRLSPEESARVAASIAGYWTVTLEGRWIIDRQNDEWNGEAGIGARWQSPWSAAFISWVMCESGLGESHVFQRAVAHHRYIDQAIRARDGGAPRAAFAAYDAGEVPIAPGDLLCSGRRPAYSTLAERRRQMGEGARTHCDVVVKVDGGNARIFAIGGNVRSAVSLKILPAGQGGDGVLRLRGSRPVFAHLKLRAEAIDADALDSSATVRALACAGEIQVPVLSSLIAVDRLPDSGCQA